MGKSKKCNIGSYFHISLWKGSRNFDVANHKNNYRLQEMKFVDKMLPKEQFPPG